MKSITNIQFVNYKAFYNDVPGNRIDIPFGKNVLIYGENGSGKSSIYEGLKQFFNSANSTIAEIPSRHIRVPIFFEVIFNEGAVDEYKDQKQSEVAVKLTFSDNDGTKEQKIFGIPFENVRGTNYISNANLLNSFLSYRELLKTYLMDNLKDREEFRKKFAFLLFEVVLAKATNSATQKTYLQSWEDLFLPKKWYKKENLEKFITGAQFDVSKINLVLEEILHYFDPSLNVQLKITDAEIEYHHSEREGRFGQYPIVGVDLTVKLFGEDVENDEENHLTVLNEARLSSLAISIYLATLVNTPQQNFDYKILFLDDIFIGLDMGNRKPLLEILTKFKKPLTSTIQDVETGKILEVLLVKEEIVQTEDEPFFKDYQIFISTYDRHWFELAKSYLPKSKWETVEMYSHFANGFDLPLIISPSSNYYQKAEIYFKKNKDFRDYPASANYLRKEFEYQFKRLLYGKYLLKNNENGTVFFKEELGELRESFKQMLINLGFDYNAYFADLSLYTKTTLNPLSHDNLSKPVFKRELQETFLLVDKLIAINKELIIPKDSKVTLTTTKDETTRITTLSFSDDVYRFTIDGVHRHTTVFLKPKNYVEGDTKIKLNKLLECEIEKAYDMIYHSVFGLKNASNGKNVNEEFILEDGSKLISKIH